MSARLGTIFVTILAVLGAIGGILGSSGYFAYVGASKGWAATCHLLQTGESRELISHDQRTELARSIIPSSEGDDALVAYFMSDCSKSVFGAAFGKK